MSTSATMSISPFRIEEAILRAMALVPNVPWVQCSLGSLRTRLGEIDADVAQENSTLLIDALVSLGVQEHMELSKIEAGQRSAFDFQRKRDDQYLNQFFGVNSFDIRLTHEGRKRIQGPSKAASESPAPVSQTSQMKICIGAFGNKYSLGKTIGNGGAGIVYEARTDDNEQCAIKILQTDQSSKVKRFKNEIDYCYRNRHKNVITVWDFGQTNGKTFYVMPLYGSTLRKLISAGIEHVKILDLFSQVLDGVEAAHLNSVCHRDLKPENILFDEATRTLVVADFGIAKFKEEELQTIVETSAHEKLANFQYSAPEQRARGKVVDHRADIYALGLILNEMFTGDIPQGVGFKKISSVAAKYSYLDPAIDSMVQQLPENRPGSIGEVRNLMRLSPLPTAKSDSANAPTQVKELSNEERERIFEEADIDFGISQGMQQTFIVRFDNKSGSRILIKKLKLSYDGIKILEAPPPDKTNWQIDCNRSQDFSWQPNTDPVTALMQIRNEWEKPFNLNLEIFVRIEILGRTKTFENRKIFCQVEPSARRIWQRL